VKSTMFRARAQELRPPITPCDVFPFGYPGVISPSRVRILSPRSSVIFGLGSACMVRKFSLSGAVGFSFQKLHSQNLICDQPAQIRELPEFRVHSSFIQERGGGRFRPCRFCVPRAVNTPAQRAEASIAQEALFLSLSPPQSRDLKVPPRPSKSRGAPAVLPGLFRGLRFERDQRCVLGVVSFRPPLHAGACTLSVILHFPIWDYFFGSPTPSGYPRQIPHVA
jgi:hypothetical protein